MLLFGADAAVYTAARRGQGSFYLAVCGTKTLLLLIVWAQQRYAADFTAVGAAFTLRRG